MVERYFAFGANLSPRTLSRRGITVLSARAARLAGYRLAFDQPAFPLVDPAFASVRPADDHVWGALYELSPEELKKLRSFEGEEYVEIGVEVESSDALGKVEARTFVTRRRHRERRPSARYLGLIVEGARHHRLPDEWIARLEAQPSLYIPVLHEVWAVAFRAVDQVHRRVVRPAERR